VVEDKLEQYSLQEAQDHLQELIASALHGKTIVIMGDNAQAVQLVPVSRQPASRKAGSAQGQVTIAKDFDASLSDFDEYMA
jgi:antitoxin (DNA-binding transcriptional repressor) of toxin-antitoxin stability system